MKLAGYIADNGHAREFKELRDLSADEMKQHALFWPAVSEGKNRFRLFQILEQNYQEWAAYLKSLLRPEPVDDAAALLELNRLLLNYLACSHTVRQHFEASFQQRFRADSSEQKRYKMLMENLCQTSWAFSFLLDFRTYMQHRGLGIGHYKRTVTPVSVTLEISHHAAELLRDSKDWPRSKLTPAKGVIETSALLREFHTQMSQTYAGIVVKTLFAEFIPAADFYKKLSGEVRQSNATMTMTFSEETKNTETGGPKLIHVPNELFAELGISLKTIK